jgi:hypothetical protein
MYGIQLVESIKSIQEWHLPRVSEGYRMIGCGVRIISQLSHIMCYMRMNQRIGEKKV